MRNALEGGGRGGVDGFRGINDGFVGDGGPTRYPEVMNFMD